MASKIARTGKVKVPKWAILMSDENGDKILYALLPTREQARSWYNYKKKFVVGLNLSVVRLEGTVTYTLAK